MNKQYVLFQTLEWLHNQILGESISWTVDPEFSLYFFYDSIILFHFPILFFILCFQFQHVVILIVWNTSKWMSTFQVCRKTGSFMGDFSSTDKIINNTMLPLEAVRVDKLYIIKE